MKKQITDSKQNKLHTLKKQLDSIEVEERLEMVQLAFLAKGGCCFINDTCNWAC